MTKEELLTERVIVTNWYPNCPFEVGDILHKSPLWHNRYGSNCFCNESLTIEIGGEDIAKAKENFRLLRWYEYRNVEDIPKYLKNSATKIVYKVLDYRYRRLPLLNGKHKFIGKYEPATEQEYQDFLKQKNK